MSFFDNDFFKRVFVWVTRFKPKILSDEEKEEMREKLIEQNKKQERDIRTLPESLLSGLTIDKVELSLSEGWLVTRPENPKEKIIYYIHGGGFVGSCTRERMPFVVELVKNFGYNVFSIDYRLAPEYPYPCGLNDCYEGYKELLESYRAKDIVLIGESAGGNLVLALLLLLRLRGKPMPRAIYANSPVTQMLKEGESFKRCSLKTDFIIVEGILQNTTEIYMTREQAKEPFVSPLLSEDLTGLPPIMITSSEDECLYDDGEKRWARR